LAGSPVQILATLGAKPPAFFPTYGLGRKSQENLVLNQGGHINFFAFIKLRFQVLPFQFNFLREKEIGLRLETGLEF